MVQVWRRDPGNGRLCQAELPQGSTVRELLPPSGLVSVCVFNIRAGYLQGAPAMCMMESLTRTQQLLPSLCNIVVSLLDPARKAARFLLPFQC